MKCNTELKWIKIANQCPYGSLLTLQRYVMQIEKALIAFVFQKYPENFAFQLFTILQ